MRILAGISSGTLPSLNLKNIKANYYYLPLHKGKEINHVVI